MENPTLTTMVVLYTMGVKLNTDTLANTLPLTTDIIKIEKQGVVKTRIFKARSNQATSKDYTTKANNRIWT